VQVADRRPHQFDRTPGLDPTRSVAGCAHQATAEREREEQHLLLLSLGGPKEHVIMVKTPSYGHFAVTPRFGVRAMSVLREDGRRSGFVVNVDVIECCCCPGEVQNST
jgi:hypothetical protein